MKRSRQIKLFVVAEYDFLGGRGKYQSGLSGVTDKNLHTVSELIHQGKKVYAEIKLPTGYKFQIKVPMSTCYHYWGPTDAKFRMGYLSTYLEP